MLEFLLDDVRPMNYSVIDLSTYQCDESASFIEGAVLAANMAVKPMPIEQWLPDIAGEEYQALIPAVEIQFHQQYALLMANQYSITSILQTEENPQALGDFSEGFMRVWESVEVQWFDTRIPDGSLRMLQALLTTMMLAIDEEQTQQQMRESGIDTPPQLAEMVENLDLMINEVANTANDLQLGAKAVRVNPYKEVGRNDPCPCGSGKKYKQCCL